MTMKLILLLLLFVNISIAQPAGKGVEVRLVNASYVDDAGLRNILNSHNVTIFQSKGGHPVPTLMGRIYQTQGADNLGTLLADLLNYSTVVESARIADSGSFSDGCQAQILNANVGTPAGFNGNIALTNDDGLNTIFQNYNVYYYKQTYPSSNSESSLRFYSIACNCDGQVLRNALEAYNGVIAKTNVMPVVYLLGIEENNVSPIKIYPNPFKFEFNIDSTVEIEKYNLFDALGKNIIDSGNYLDFKNKLQNINSGMYLLNLKTAAGSSEMRKVIKQ